MHEADTVNEALVLAVTERARAVASVAPEIPGPVARVVDRSLAYEKEERFQTATEMQAAVRAAYAEYLLRRLEPPRPFVEEAIRARKGGVG